MNGYKVATKFVSRIVVGSIAAIWIGMKIDKSLHTTPWVMIGLLLYAIVGSMILLVKELTHGR